MSERQDRRNEDWEIENVKASRKFFNQLAVWLVMSVFFIYLNISGGSSFPWAAFPIVFWGLDIFQKGMKLFGPGSVYYRKTREHHADEEQSSLQMPDADRLDLPRQMHSRENAEPQQKNWRDKDLV